MKKHLSVLGLWSQIHLGRILCVLALMVVLEAALFGWNLGHVRGDYEDVPADLSEVLGGVPLIAGAAFFTVVFLLSQGSDAEPNAGYTLRRLRVREEETVLWKAGFNCLCLLLLWAVQTAAAVGFACWYAAHLPEAFRSGQTVFLAFYRVECLHNLLPLDHATRYLRNAALVLALGFAAAMRTYKLRHGSRFGWGFPLFLGAIAWGCFSWDIAQWQIDLLVAAVALGAAAIDGGYLIEGWGGMRDED